MGNGDLDPGRSAGRTVESQLPVGRGEPTSYAVQAAARAYVGSALAVVDDGDRRVRVGLPQRDVDAGGLVISEKPVHKQINRILAKLDLPEDGSSARRVQAVLAYLRG